MSRMVGRRFEAVGLVLCAAAVAWCGSSSKSPTSPSDGGTTITGSENIGWTQTAGSLAEARSYTYGMYVDGTRVTLKSATCATGQTGFECSVPLPPLTNGRHVLELFAIDPNGIESPRASGVVVTVAR